MTSNESLSILLYTGGALLFGIAGLFVIGCFVGMQSHFRKWLPASLFPLLLAAIALSSIFSNRDLSYADTDMTLMVLNDTAAVTWLLRGVTLIILGICFARIISSMQKGEIGIRQGRTLYFAFLFFFLTNVVLNNIFGVVPIFDQKLIYPVFLFTALFLSRKDDKYFSIHAIKIGLLAFVSASLLFAVLMPGMALQKDYADGWIAALNIRLWGLGSHPNTLAPLALVFLLVTLYQPFRRRWLQYSAIALSLLTLLLAQSKTSWFAAIVTVLVMVWARYRYNPSSSARPKPSNSFRQLSTPIFVCVVGIAVVLGAAVVNHKIESQSAAKQEEISTLSGRTQIWNVAKETWEQNPAFGYGATAWGEDFRTRIDMGFAYSAHNQFFQTLSEAGAVGVAGLMIYLITLMRYALLANAETRGLSSALFLILLIRCYTEVPFTMSNMFTAEFIVHLILFRLLLATSSKKYSSWQPQQQYQLQWR